MFHVKYKSVVPIAFLRSYCKVIDFIEIIEYKSYKNSNNEFIRVFDQIVL